MLTETKVKAIKPVRYARTYTDGRGLYLLVTPKGARCWRYAYRFAKKYRKLSLGTYPVITLEWASKGAFAAMMREWDSAPGHLSVLPPSEVEAIRVLRL